MFQNKTNRILFAGSLHGDVDMMIVRKLVDRANGISYGPDEGPIEKHEFMNNYLGSYAVRCIQDTLTLQDYGDIIILGAKLANSNNSQSSQFENYKVQPRMFDPSAVIEM